MGEKGAREQVTRQGVTHKGGVTDRGVTHRRGNTQEG